MDSHHSDLAVLRMYCHNHLDSTSAAVTNEFALVRPITLYIDVVHLEDVYHILPRDAARFDRIPGVASDHYIEAELRVVPIVTRIHLAAYASCLFNASPDFGFTEPLP
jgi:hypothetical protein